MVCFQRRCSRAEKSQCIFQFGADNGYVATVVARSFFLLVAGFLLFINNDEAKVFYGRKNRGPRSDDDAGFAIANAPPFARPLDVAQRGMQYRNAFEARAKPG